MRQCYNRLDMDTCHEVGAYIEQEALLQRGQTLVAAVSGGADSLCMMDCLYRLGYRLIVAHLDHQLREESRNEAEVVRQLAADYGLQVVVGREDVAGFAQTGTSLEEAARLVRYRFLVKVARQHGVETIATGHTSDDQAETVLMHFLRGAGISGLRGMLPATALENWVGIPDAEGLTLIRPLLRLTRHQTQTHCESVGLNPIHDPSNLDPTFFRNRLRHELLPLLETYNPGIKAVLNRTARVMAAAAQWNKSLVGACWDRVVRDVEERALALRVDVFLEQPLALRRAILREMVGKLRPTLRDVGFEVIDRACQFIEVRIRGKRMTLLGGLEMLHQKDEVYMYGPDAALAFPEYPQLSPSGHIELRVPGRVELASGWMMVASEEQVTPHMLEAIKENRTGQIAAMDAACLGAPFVVRSPRSGDRIRPLGMKGSVKVAELFVNNHIPQPARSRWPIVVCGDLIVWVSGLRMSDEVRLTKTSRVAVVLRLQEPKEGGRDETKI
ncbi:MAG: tRNA lysidine(34) synthetase TilS [Anaerolineales bacterium]|nr:tRNA lysidine(34) synthetase TilS [Anaerolineales bacterium]